MVASSTKYKGRNVVSKMTIRSMGLPELFESEYDEDGDLVAQRLYDVIQDEKGNKSNHLKLESKLFYNEDKKISKIVSPVSTIEYDYSEKEIYVPRLYKNISVNSSSITTNKINTEQPDSDKKPNHVVVSYVADYSGGLVEDYTDKAIEFDNIRIAEYYDYDDIELRNRVTIQYDFIKCGKLVYSELRDGAYHFNSCCITEYKSITEPESPIIRQHIIDKDAERRIETFHDYNTGIYTNLDDVSITVTSVNFPEEIKAYECKEYDLNDLDPDEYDCDPITYKEIYFDKEEVEVNGETLTKHTCNLREYDDKTEEEDIIPMYELYLDKNNCIVRYVNLSGEYVDVKLSYSNDTIPYKAIINRKDSVKITPFTKDKKAPTKQEEIGVYLYSEYNDKIVTTSFIKYPTGLITKNTIILNDKYMELANISTTNMEDGTVGAMFESLVSDNN